MKVEATGMTYWKRVVNDSGEVVAILSQLASGKWIINDKTDKKLTNNVFKDIAHAKKWMAEHSELFL